MEEIRLLNEKMMKKLAYAGVLLIQCASWAQIYKVIIANQQEKKLLD